MDYFKKKFEIEPGEFIWLKFEWHDAKSEFNKAKHDLSFEEAVELFARNYDGTIQSQAKSKNYVDKGLEEREQISIKDENGKLWLGRDTTMVIPSKLSE